MPKPSKFSYEKRLPFRNAFYFIIICEGQSREPDYFRFFVGLSQRVKIVPVESLSGSAPNKLVDNAIAKEKELDADPKIDKVWFVIDTDRWREQLHEIRKECKLRQHWCVAQSNPCFEVWLYFHAKAQLPVLENIAQCNNWKPHLPKIMQGGFNPDFHPAAIETALNNAKNCYAENGYFPEPGSTQVWKLAEELMPLIKKDLDAEKHRFSLPVVIG
jgi:RloB-like protein